MNGTLRKMAYWGAQHGPRWWLKYSPSPIGALAFALQPRERRRLRALLGWVQGRPATSLETLAGFTAFAHCLAESLALGAHPADVAREGGESLRDWVEQGNGAVIVTSHTGAWDLAAHELARALRTRVVLAMQPERDERARRVHDRVRALSGVVVHYLGDQFDALALLAELRRGTVVAFQLDRAARSGRALETRLFDRVFLVPEGPFALAARAGVPIVAAFCRRMGFLRHTVRVTEPVFTARRASREELARLAQDVVSSFQEFVAEAPNQWFHFDEVPASREPRGKGSSGHP